MDVGQNITTSDGSWSFKGKNVAENFVSHVSLSVPFYYEGQYLVCDISEYFMRPNNIHYEIGSSTGELTKRIAERHSHKENSKIVGIEIEPEMVKKAKSHCFDIANVSFEEADIENYDFEQTDFIVSYYCIQFIKPSIRQQIINKIYDSLNQRAFLLFEKVRAPIVFKIFTIIGIIPTNYQKDILLNQF